MDVRHPTADDLEHFLAVSPQVVDTAAGPVEYAEAGGGPVLVSVHGSSGGWDHGLGMAALFALNGYRVIAPSRPGILGTPLATASSSRATWVCCASWPTADRAGA